MKPLIEIEPPKREGSAIVCNELNRAEVEKHNHDQLMGKLPVARGLDKERDELALRKQELEEKERNMVEKYTQLERMNRDRANLLRDLDYGENHSQQLKNWSSSLETTLNDWCFPGHHPNPQFQSVYGTIGLVNNCIAAERALQYYPAWLDSQKKKLAEIERGMKALAKELKIADRLPAELQ